MTKITAENRSSIPQRYCDRFSRSSMNPRVCNFQKTDSSPPWFGEAVNQGFAAAKRLYIIAQGFSPGFFEQTFDLKASTDRAATPHLALTILDAPSDWMPIEPDQIGRPFRALPDKTIPRVETLGYDVQPLRGKKRRLINPFWSCTPKRDG